MPDPAPVWGGVLIGGGARRMGAPKHLLRHRGATLAELAVEALAPHVDGVVLIGAGAVPEPLAGLPRLADANLAAAIGDGTGAAVERSAAVPVPASPSTPEPAARPIAEPSAAPTAERTAGPLAGMLAAVRWRPEAAWLFAPCDLPEIAPAAAAWLLGERRPGRWAVLPRVAAGAPVEPLFALYEPPAHRLLEDLARSPPPGRAPRRLAAHPRVAAVTVPPALARCWAGANTPAELAALLRPEGPDRRGG